jgi:hypothetical protein
MGIYKFSNSGGFGSNRQQYSSMLAGNSAYVPLPIVTGGTLTSDATYYYRTFTASATLSVSTAPLTCDYLVVAGGGSGGGGSSGGGGGAGGYLASVGGSGGGGANGSPLTLSVGSQSIVIGAGGPGILNSGSYGNDSIFSSITATRGGVAGGNGGSGGGANSGGGPSNLYPFGLGTSGQGYNGGDKSQASNYPGGGGGGSGSAGGNASSGQGGSGGAGKNSLSSWFSVVGLGVSGYIAGGGGGGGQSGGTAGSAGSGGAGAGFMTIAGGDATANTGSGGGGCGYASGVGYRGGNGGSGLVIIRYTKASVGG